MKRRRKAPDRVFLPYEIPESRCFVFRPGRGVCRAGAGRDLSRQRAGDRPFEPPPRGLCRRGAGRQEQKGASTDSLGRFRIERVKPGIWRLAVSSVGYKSLTTPEYMVSAATPFIEVELEEDAAQLEAVTVRPSPFRVTAESPVSLKVIGLREIEKSPGLEPRRVAHRALVSRRGLFACGVSQRFDRARRRACGEQVLHGRDRNPEHQPFRHAGGDGRSGEHRSTPTSCAKPVFIREPFPPTGPGR